MAAIDIAETPFAQLARGKLAVPASWKQAPSPTTCSTCDGDSDQGTGCAASVSSAATVGMAATQVDTCGEQQDSETVAANFLESVLSELGGVLTAEADPEKLDEHVANALTAEVMVTTEDGQDEQPGNDPTADKKAEMFKKAIWVDTALKRHTDSCQMTPHFQFILSGGGGERVYDNLYHLAFRSRDPKHSISTLWRSRDNPALEGDSRFLRNTGPE